MALQIPDWFDKTPEEVASDSRLQGHYLNARLGDDGFVADVASQIPFACAYVTNP